MKTKICSKCGVDKPVEEYHRLSNRSAGIQARCKACQSEYHRTRYTNDPEYRARRKATSARAYNEDEEYRQRCIDSAVARYQNDPEYREHEKADRRYKYANDPEFRAKRDKQTKRTSLGASLVVGSCEYTS